MTDSVYLYDIPDLWDDSETVYTGIGFHVTDEGSHADSRLQDISIDGLHVFQITKTGTILLANQDTTNKIFALGGQDILFGGTDEDSAALKFSSGAVTFAGPTFLGMTSTESAATGTVDFGWCNDRFYAIDEEPVAALYPQAASDVALRIYRDASVDGFSRLAVVWDGDDVELVAQAGGTGTPGALRFNATNRVAYNPLPTLSDLRDLTIAWGLMEAAP